MQNRKPKSLSVILAVLLLLAVPGVGITANAASGKPDFSDASFTVRDLIQNRTAAFRGDSGKPAVLVFGGIGTCWNTNNYIKNMRELLPMTAGEMPQIFFIDIKDNPDEEILAAIGAEPLPAGVVVGAERTMSDADVYYDLFRTLSKGSDSITMPLVAYLDAGGVMQSGTTGNVTKKKIIEDLAAIGVSIEIPDTQIDVPFEVQYRQTEARAILRDVNALRTGDGAWYWNSDNKTKTVLKNLSPLTYDYALEEVAMQRALELIARYDHVRPNNEICFSAFEEQDYACGNAGENIAYGFSSAASVQQAWEEEADPYEGQGHRRNMLNGDYRAFGCACVEYDGVRYWVQEFSDTVNNARETAPANGSAVKTISLLPDYINGWFSKLAEVELQEGQTIPLDSLTEIWVFYEENALLTAIRPEWKSGDPKIAVIDADGILTAVSAGSTEVTGQTAQKDVAVSFQVTVTARPAFSPGDVDGNGEIEVTDARNALRAAVGLENYAPASREFLAADTDGNGEIEVGDARNILRAAVGLDQPADWKK